MTPLRAGLVTLILAASANSAWAGALEDAERAYRTGDYAAARQLYAVLAEQGDSHAETNLGLMYANGAGGAADLVGAAALYRKAALQGNRVAEYNLGDLLARGQGVAQDEAEAASWYRKSAEQGVGEAQVNLGQFYAAGRGVAQDEDEAMKWYRLAAEQGLGVAQYNLGDLYQNRTKHGAGDDILAVKWCRLAVTQQVARPNAFRPPATSADTRAKAAACLRSVEARMTPDQIAEGEQQATTWRPAGP